MKIFLFALSLISISAFAKTTPVSYVDLDRYLGQWYEVASIPQWFSKNCFCTRAEYGMRKDGKISVLNTCNKKSVSGKLSDAKGKAKIVDKKTNAKLKVSFFRPFYGDYWVIGLASDYRYAVVSNEEGSTLWILSRTPQMDPRDYEEALEIARTNGVKVSKLKQTEQRGCEYA